MTLSAIRVPTHEQPDSAKTSLGVIMW